MRPIPIVLAVALAACAPRALATAQEVPGRWGPYTTELVDEGGRVLPTFEHRGRTYVLGTIGQRYLLRFRNGSGRRIEVVASVDGRDVVDGRPAAFTKRGYVVAPYGELTIDGYRLSQASVAAFRFSTVPRSYAARKGDARDVGVVGVAVFPERFSYPAPPQYPYPYPERGDADEGVPQSSAPHESSPGVAPPPASAERHAGKAAPPGPRALGDSAQADARSPAPQRPGLGTEFGEEHVSHVEHVAFERASPSPEAVLTLRYDDRPGLLALGIDVDGDGLARASDRRLRESATPFRTDGYCEPPRGWAAR
jgi:hypothetical protein